MFIPSLNVLAFLAGLLAILLVAYLYYVKISQHRYTEKRFRFIALWCCTTLAFLLISSLLDHPPWRYVLSHFADPTPTPGFFEQLFSAIVVLYFIHKIIAWSGNWEGSYTHTGYVSRSSGDLATLLADGLSETRRIISFKRPLPIHESSAARSSAPILPTPIAVLPFREQVREFITARHVEYVIFDEDWVEDAKCWRGRDSSLNAPLLVISVLDKDEIDSDRVLRQVAHDGPDNNVLLIIAVKKSMACDVRQTIMEPFHSTQGIASIKLFSLDDLIEYALPLERYQHDIHDEFTKSTLPNVSFSLANVFVPTRIRDELTTKKDADKHSANLCLDEHLEAWLSGSVSYHLALLGDYGQGKSSAALELTHRLLQDTANSSGSRHRLPILIRLTGLSPAAMTPEDLLGAWGSRYGLNGRALMALHTAGRTLLIFDAFDEMANVSDRADRFNHFGTLWRFSCKGSRILFTGRPNFFLDDTELRVALGISASSGTGPYCRAIYIEPFCEEQMKKSLRWLPQDMIAAFFQTLATAPQLREMAERPSLLFQLALLWHEGKLNLAGNGIGSASIIREFVQYCLERQVSKQYADVTSGEYDKQFVPLRQSELEYFTIGCAVASLSAGRGNFLSELVFRETIGELWHAAGEQQEFLRRPMEVGSLSMPLKERFRDQPNAIEACQQAVRTHGVIEHDPTRPGSYKFSHKSFPEALTAAAIVDGASGDDSIAALVWSVTKPFKLITQDAVFQFVHDLAIERRARGVYPQEYEAFARVMGTTTSSFGRMTHKIIRWLVNLDLLLLRNAPRGLDVFEGNAGSSLRYSLLLLSTAIGVGSAVILVNVGLAETLFTRLGRNASVAVTLGILVTHVIWLWLLYVLRRQRDSGQPVSTMILFCYMLGRASNGGPSDSNKHVVRRFERAIRRKLARSERVTSVKSANS